MLIVFFTEFQIFFDGANSPGFDYPRAHARYGAKNPFSAQKPRFELPLWTPKTLPERPNFASLPLLAYPVPRRLGLVLAYSTGVVTLLPATVGRRFVLRDLEPTLLPFKSAAPL